eukprot:3940232-Rhodomonas_salina.2
MSVPDTQTLLEISTVGLYRTQRRQLVGGTVPHQSYSLLPIIPSFPPFVRSCGCLEGHGGERAHRVLQ